MQVGIESSGTSLWACYALLAGAIVSLCGVLSKCGEFGDIQLVGHYP